MTPVRDAGPARPGGPAGQPGIMTIKIRRVVRQLSAPLVVLVAALLAAGGSLACSPISTAHRSGRGRPRFVGLVAATRRWRRCLRCVRLRPVAAPAEVRPAQRPPVGTRAARQACRPADGPDPRRASRPVRARPRTARRASHRGVLVFLLRDSARSSAAWTRTSPSTPGAARPISVPWPAHYLDGLVLMGPRPDCSTGSCCRASQPRRQTATRPVTPGFVSPPLRSTDRARNESPATSLAAQNDAAAWYSEHGPPR